MLVFSNNKKGSSACSEKPSFFRNPSCPYGMQNQRSADFYKCLQCTCSLKYTFVKFFVFFQMYYTDRSRSDRAMSKFSEDSSIDISNQNSATFAFNML